jgi:hypothetical protein
VVKINIDLHFKFYKTPVLDCYLGFSQFSNYSNFEIETNMVFYELILQSIPEWFQNPPMFNELPRNNKVRVQNIENRCLIKVYKSRISGKAIQVDPHDILSDQDLLSPVNRVSSNHGSQFSVIFNCPTLDTFRRTFLQKMKNLERDMNAKHTLQKSKLKKIVQVSEKLRIHQIAKFLDMTESDVYAQILDWAYEFGFVIDEDLIIFSKGRKDDFIKMLDNQFISWEKNEVDKKGKSIDCPVCHYPIAPYENPCSQCGAQLNWNQ